MVSSPKLEVGVVVHRERRLLLGRRDKTGEAVSWSLPGATLEDRESFEQAARRELVEVTGVRAASATVFALGLTSSSAGEAAYALQAWENLRKAYAHGRDLLDQVSPR